MSGNKCRVGRHFLTQDKTPDWGRRPMPRGRTTRRTNQGALNHGLFPAIANHRYMRVWYMFWIINIFPLFCVQTAWYREVHSCATQIFNRLIIKYGELLGCRLNFTQKKRTPHKWGAKCLDSTEKITKLLYTRVLFCLHLFILSLMLAITHTHTHTRTERVTRELQLPIPSCNKTIIEQHVLPKWGHKTISSRSVVKRLN